MPTSTFFNLSKEKQDNILECAKKEFEEKAFYDASINKIVKEAGISRGAFYLYFDNKEDLFLYLMQGNRDEMLEKITAGIDKNNNDIFDLALLIFDYVTSADINDECQKLIVANITKIDLNLILNCMKLQDNAKEIAMMKKYSNIDKLKIKDDEDLIFISELVFSSFVVEVINIFSEKSTAKRSRKNLERKFAMIKNGILK